MVLDPGASVGIRTDAGGSAATLALRSAGGDRTLAELPAGTPASLPVTANGDQVYWMQGGTGGSPYTIWVAGRGGGGPRAVTMDTGAVRLSGSERDLQVADGRLIWASGAADGSPATEIRSVAPAGGPVDVRRVDGVHVLSAWPWVTSPASGPGTPARMVNLDTSERRDVTPSTDAQVYCSPVGCRMLTGGPDGLALDLYRPDGQDVRRIIDGNVQPLVSDIALLDRFEPVMLAPGPAVGASGVVELSVYDTVKGQLVLIAAVASHVGARNGFLWWSTGDPADPSWRVVDLRALR